MSTHLRTLLSSIVLTSGLEAETDGKARIEAEDMLLVKPTDPEFYKGYGSKIYESWELRSHYDDDDDRNNNKGMVRIRKEGDSYRFVTKLFDQEDGHALESEVEITEDFFNIVKKLFPIGCIKRRVKIPSSVDGLTWECDVYQNLDGSLRSEWVKLDMEYPEGVDRILPPLPFECKEVMGPNFTDEQNELKKELFEEVFNLYNADSMLPIAGEDDDDDKVDDDEDEL